MNKIKIPKINSIHFGGYMIGTALITGLVIPGITWLVFHVLLWYLCIAGAIIMAAFVIIYVIEMKQDNGKYKYYEKHLRETIPYDSEKEYAVIKCSICTGEKVAGFKNRENGHFKEVMLIKDSEDEKKFKKIYELDKIVKEY